MSQQNGPRPPGALRPESWRSDLLRIVLRVTAGLGVIVYLPSVYFAAKFGMTGLVVLDTTALAVALGLAFFKQIPTGVRSACSCLVFYSLGVGLMVVVGSISQIYLFGFSLLTLLLLSVRWGLATVALNALTMLAIGYVGIAFPEMVLPRWSSNFTGWVVITCNFVFVNLALVLAMSAVIEALEHEQRKLVRLNSSLEQEINERRRADESLLESRTLLRIAGQTARLGGWRVDAIGRQVAWSDEVREIYELDVDFTPTSEQAIAFYVLPERRQSIREAVLRCGQDGTPFDAEAEIITSKGTRRWVRTIGRALRNATGTITHVHGSVQDITPQKLAEARHEALEEQLRQAQKLETIGSLAGGVAHDFNNLLTVILSYSQMLTRKLHPTDPMRADLEAIRGAGARAVALTRQLLAFSRQQVLEPRLTGLSDIVIGMESMLRRLIGDDVELVTSCAPGPSQVLVDPGQIEQVILNLAVNARDAMPLGGLLRITTAEVTLDESYASEHVGVTPGLHAMLAVSDAGIGMDKATQARMFEPFFTTKEKGKGTGLGLATVFGIIQQSGGTIWVDSEPGKGTNFKIYFPVATASAVPAAAPSADSGAVSGTETILLVEDEDAVRMLTRTLLQNQGYEVLEAQNGTDALRLSAQHPAPIHLLLTDVVMPRMSGRQLAEQLQPIRPDMKVLYMSGYTDDDVVRHGVREATVAFIQKPFTPEPLARKIREVLDARPAPG